MEDSYKGIITKTGDGGKTTIGGRRLWKSDLLIETVGIIDELEAFTGDVRLYGKRRIKKEVKIIQQQLKLLMGVISIDIEDKPNQDQLEDFCKKHFPLNTPVEFSFPGENKYQNAANKARVFCRRAERQLIRYIHEGNTSLEKNYVLRQWQKYLNRLSDYFYLLLIETEF